MAEPARLNIVLLLIAMANLATDITRLAMEWAPSGPLHGALKSKMNGDQPHPYGQGPDAGEPRRAPFSRLPPDFSHKRSPWCLACRQPMRPFERRNIYGWDRFYE